MTTFITNIIVDARLHAMSFDTFPHDKLLVKLFSIGITGNLWKWFYCYLTNQTQCVRINNQLQLTI